MLKIESCLNDIAARLIVCLTATAMTAGCAWSSPLGEYRVEVSQTEFATFDPAQLVKEREHLKTRPSNYGIAISGGGIRSALFSFGVLKAMYDAGKLEDLDYLSSVSGGGYTAYSLYTSHLDDKEQTPFGAHLFEGNNFYKETCELTLRSNFVTNKGYASTMSPRVSGKGLYENAILRSFNRDECFREYQNNPQSNCTVDGDLKMAALMDVVQANPKLPFPIVNAAVQTPNPTNYRDGGFEITPIWLGTEEAEYKPWDDETTLEYHRAVAISGAALASLFGRSVLEQEVPYTYLEQIDEELVRKNYVISDGGHVENLGALALIRRGPEKVVILDAENDPGVTFGAYKILKGRLDKFGWNLTIRTIDDWVQTQPDNRKSIDHIVVHRGVAVNPSYDGKRMETDVYYIKMSVPRVVDEWIDPHSDSVKRCKSMETNQCDGEEGCTYDCQFRETLNIVGPDKGDPAYCKDLDQVVNPPYPTEWAKFMVGTYRAWFDNSRWMKLLRRPPFPHFTTADQSFYNDQARAWIWLGYLQGLAALDELSGN